MATVTKFVDTDAFSTTTFNNKIDEINTALLSAGKSAFATIGTSVSETALVYTSDDCDYFCGTNPEENTNIIQKAMNENDCVCFLSGVYNISKPIIVEGKTFESENKIKEAVDNYLKVLVMSNLITKEQERKRA